MLPAPALSLQPGTSIKQLPHLQEELQEVTASSAEARRQHQADLQELQQRLQSAHTDAASADAERQLAMQRLEQDLLKLQAWHIPVSPATQPHKAPCSMMITPAQGASADSKGSRGVQTASRPCSTWNSTC